MNRKFTKQYPLTKTLRFELRPYGKTAISLEKSGIKQTDKERHENFKELKKWFDKLYRQFIDESLEVVELPLEELKAFVATPKADDPSHKALRKHFIAAFTATRKKWQIGTKDPLSPESIIQILEQKFPEANAIAGQFKGFTTYIRPFYDNRQHMFGDAGKAAQIATRAIDENLPIFLANIERAKLFAGFDVPGFDRFHTQFELEGYGDYLSQGRINAYNAAIGEINSIINELRQRLEKAESRKLPLLRPLYKQILSDRPTYIELLETSEQLKELVGNLLSEAEKSDLLFSDISHSFFEGNTQLSHIYVKRTALNTMANAWFGDWAFAYTVAPKKGDDKQDTFISVAAVLQGLDAAEGTVEELFNTNDVEVAAAIKIGTVSRTFWDIWRSKLHLAKQTEEVKRQEAKAINNYASEDQIAILKGWLDARKSVEQMLRWWQLEHKCEVVTELERDETFYALLDKWYGANLTDAEQKKYIDFFEAYNKIRNFLTKKLYSVDKWKLNFNASNLLGGWDKNKEKENLGVLLLHQGKYFLVVINKEAKTTVFEPNKNPSLYHPDNAGWQKIDYKFLPTPHMMLPKTFFAKGNIRTVQNPKGWFDPPSEEIVRINQQKTFKKEDLVKADLVAWIDSMKLRLSQHPEWNVFTFDFKVSSAYEDVSDFYFDVARAAYKLSFLDINSARLNEMVENDEIFLFEVTNKDLRNTKSESHPNIHTLYLKLLLSESNTRQNIKMKLNGEAEIFFRPKSFEVEHEQRKGVEVIKHRRFTRDLIQFHVPVTINFGTREIVNSRFNANLNEVLRVSKSLRVIGIDRGEKHLAYVAICDEQGRLVEAPKSLNVLEGVDYYGKLTDRAKNRDDARKGWQAIQQIKDLKTGFVAHAAKYIADLAIKHNAIIALENLNFGFKRGRLRIEHANYQRFEGALLSKLQYYVDKVIPDEEPGGAANGLQLVPSKIGPGNTKSSTQVGRVLFVKAAYTSAIDPITGFRRCFTLDEAAPLEQVLRGFEKIYFDAGTQSYHFIFSWSNLAAAISKKSKNAYPSKVWTITADVDRLRFRKNAKGGGETENLNPNEVLQRCLGEADFDVRSSDLKNLLLKSHLSARFRKDFYFAFNLITQLRNVHSKENLDYILSPVIGSQFDSRNKLNGYDWNGDANGALNIARKGVLILGHIQSSLPGEKLDWQHINSDAAWDEWYSNIYKIN